MYFYGELDMDKSDKKWKEIKYNLNLTSLYFVRWLRGHN